MTLEKTIELAKDGDLKAVRSLGIHYLNGDENQKANVFEARKWFVIGAEKGDALCMHLSATTGAMIAYALKDASDYTGTVNILNDALSWEKKALGIGYSAEQDESILIDIQGNLGIAHYFLSLDAPDKEEWGPVTLKNIEEAICFLKASYQKTNNKEVLIYLGFALLDYYLAHKATKDDEILAHTLIKKCVDSYFKEIKVSAVAASYLGLMYTDGIGCEKNYEMAVYYLQKAHAAGYDCSNMLSRFKKTLFGKYKFI